jgi:uncharacterized surface protein with fasciclin (FAS1) repeats
MSPNRLLLASAALMLVASPALAQTPATAKTEAAAQAATGKATTDKPAATQPQGTAKAVTQAAPAAQAAKPAAAQAAEGAAPAASMAKPVAAQGDLLDTLKLSGQFTNFVKGIDSTNLSGLLKTNKNLTVFAPTDAAFAAMPKAELDKLMADKPALQQFVLRHVVNAPIEAAKIKGAKGPVPSAATGDQILLDGSDEAALKVDGAKIVQADIRTGSGLLHVVDKVLPAGLGGDPSTGEAPAAGAAAAPAASSAAAAPAAPAAKPAAKPQ